jgi:hypothetical protein
VYIFVAGSEVLFYVSGFLLTTKYWYDTKGGWNLQAEIPWMQGGFEGIQQARSEDGIIWIQHINHVEGYIFYARILWGVEWHGQGFDPNRFNSFVAEALEGLHWLFELFSVVAHFLEGRQEKDFSLAAIVDKDFGYVPSIDVDGDNHDIGMWKRR